MKFKHGALTFYRSFIFFLCRGSLLPRIAEGIKDRFLPLRA